MKIIDKYKNKALICQCPKCGRWCYGETGNLLDRVSNGVDSGCEQIEPYENSGKTGIGKVLRKTTGTIGEIYVGLLGGVLSVLSNYMANFSCSCGHDWHDFAMMEKTKFDVLSDTFFEKIKNVSSIQLEDVYSNLAEVFRIKQVYEQINDKEYLVKYNNKYQELNNILVSNFTKIESYSRRFIFLTDEDDIIYYPKNYYVISRKDACRIQTRFMGGLGKNVLYIKHPYKEVYYPQESYAYEVFKDEVEEFEKVMAMLGAKKISSIIIEETKHDVKNNFDLSIESDISAANSRVSGKCHYNNDEEQKLSVLKKQIEHHEFEAQKGRERRSPYKNENPWFDEREDWQRKADQIIKYGETTLDFTISIEREMSSIRSELESLSVEYKNMAEAAKLGTESLEKIAANNMYAKVWTMKVLFYSHKELKLKKEGLFKRLWYKLFHYR